jgi:hypothetical protein
MISKSKGTGELMQVILNQLDQTLFTMTRDKEDKIVESLMAWLNEKARLKPVPDLAARLLSMEPKLRKMASKLNISVQKGKFVFRADAESEALLNSFRRGSMWFDPHPDVDAAILASVIEAD